MRRVKTAVLISGSGSNMMSLVEAAKEASFPAEIAVVISNKLEAAGMEKARKAKVPIVGIDHRPFGEDRERHERLVQAVLNEAGIELVCLAGYMRIFTPYFVSAWSGKMINIHPALLPAFPGLHTHRRALEAGVFEHGCSVHWVIDAVDEGPLIGQARVPVLPGDTEETLGARVLVEEHKLYPACLAKAAAEIAAK